MGPEWGPIPANLSVWRDTWILLSENVSSEREMVWQPHREGVVVYGATLTAWILAINILLLLVLFRRGPGGRQGLWLLGNLLLAQLLTGLLVVPWNVRTEAVGGWTFGFPACRAWIVAKVGLAALTTWTVLAITLDRLIYAADPLVYSRRMTSCRVAALLSLTWLASIGACAPAVWRMLTDEDFVVPEVCAVAVERHYALVFSTSAFLLPAALALILSTSLVLLVLCTRTRHTLVSEEGDEAQTQPCCPEKEEAGDEEHCDSTAGESCHSANCPGNIPHSKMIGL